MKTTGSKNIKDYKVGTRILYRHRPYDSCQYEAIISEFSDSGEYVCLEYSSNKRIDWHSVTDIIVIDTLKDKHSKALENFIKKEREQFAREEALFQKYDKMSYEQKVADAIDEECRMTEEDYDEIDWTTLKEENSKEKTKPNKNDSFTEVVRLSDYKVFTKNDYNHLFYHIDRETFFNETYTVEAIQKFIDQGLFMILKRSSDPMWQKPLSTSNPIPNTTSP